MNAPPCGAQHSRNRTSNQRLFGFIAYLAWKWISIVMLTVGSRSSPTVVFQSIPAHSSKSDDRFSFCSYVSSRRTNWLAQAHFQIFQQNGLTRAIKNSYLFNNFKNSQFSIVSGNESLSWPTDSFLLAEGHSSLSMFKTTEPRKGVYTHPIATSPNAVCISC
jgi:hypothetical protein